MPVRGERHHLVNLKVLQCAGFGMGSFGWPGSSPESDSDVPRPEPGQKSRECNVCWVRWLVQRYGQSFKAIHELNDDFLTLFVFQSVEE